MSSDYVNTWPWKCADCISTEHETPDFKAAILAITIVRPLFDNDSDARTTLRDDQDGAVMRFRGEGFASNQMSRIMILPGNYGLQTIVWQRRSHGAQPDVESFFVAWAEGGVSRPRPGYWGTGPNLGSRYDAGPKFRGRVLDSDEIAHVPCGRDHHGEWNADGTWTAVPGTLIVSNALALERIRQHAA